MIQIIPKPERKPFILERIFLFFSVIILIFSLFSFFYLKNLEKKLKEELKNWEEKIFISKTSEILSLEKEILNYQQKISDFSKILKELPFPSRFFEILEKNTLSQIYFSRIDLDLMNSKCLLAGEVLDFYSLGQQFEIFKNLKSFQTKLSKITFGKEGKVEFEFEIIFEKNILKR